MAKRHKTVTATAAAANVTLDGPARLLRIENVDGAGYVSAIIGGTAASGADENAVIAKAAGANRELQVQNWPVTVSVIASADTVIHLMCVDFDDE